MKSFRLALWAIFLLPCTVFSQGKITLTPDMITNITTKGDATLLIDEQQLVGSPKHNTGGTPSTTFNGGYNSMYFPLKVIIDLGVLHQLDELFLYDSFNKDSLKIYTGSPFNWQLSATPYLGGWRSWISVNLNTNTRYIMLEFPSNKANVAEIVLYGRSLGAVSSKPGPYTHQLPLMEDFIGANALHNQPIEKLKCVGSIREYHPWQWDEGNGKSSYPGYPNSEYAWSPSWVSGSAWGWDFDETYKTFQDAGFDLSPCLQQSAPYVLDTVANVDHKPINALDNPTNPASYAAHAQYLYQFTARYGSNPVSPSKLKLRSTNTPKSGLGLVKYVENWNEGDKWWRGREGYFTPYEMAAMCSADFDGHEGSMGAGYGAKNADPNIKFVMGGLTILGLEYIKAMKVWSDHNRTTGFPADVLNFHHYSNASGGQDNPMIEGISPEDDSLKYRLAEIVEYRDRYLPGKEIWLSEFGYDTNPNSPQGAKAIGQNDVYEVQAQWLLRSYLEMAAAGIDRAHMYFFADINAPNPNKFNSSGLVTEKWYNYQPKKSWYYLYAMKKALTGYRFEAEIPSGNPSVNIYQFYNEKTLTSIYAAWCNTSVDKRLPGFPVPVQGTVGATLLTLHNGDTTATETNLNINSKGEVLVDLSERPVFIRAVKQNSKDCLNILAKDRLTVQLDQGGQAIIQSSDINNGSKSNCGPLSFSLSQNTLDCQDVSGGFYVEVNSDSSWMMSTVTDNSTSMSFPWLGVNGNLPSTPTFTDPVTLGQPKSYHSIDRVPGSQVIKSGSHITFYRKTFNVPDTINAHLFTEMTVDDDMEIYLNGQLLAREESHHYRSATFPSHRFTTSSSTHPTNTAHEAFDYTHPNADGLLKKGNNEVIIAVRNKSRDNGGFSFRLGVGNPFAGGHKVTLTAVDNITNATDTASTIVQVIDILPPQIDLKANPEVFLDATGSAAVSLNDLRTAVTDNCALSEVTYQPTTVSCLQLQDSAVVEIVSDESWVKSSVTDSKNAFTHPWAGTFDLPDSSTYTISASTGQPFNYRGIYKIPGTEVISTDAHVTFFKKSFELNLGTINESWIELTVDDDIEVYINGQLIAREGSFSNVNSLAPAHRLYSDATTITNGYQGGDAFDFISGSSIVSALNPSGKNEIVLAVRNGGNNNVGGFSFKLSIPLLQKHHVPASITATDKYGNTNTAYTSLKISDTIPPTAIVTSALLTPNAHGIIVLDPQTFNNGSYDNCEIASFSVLPGVIDCHSGQQASITVADVFGNTSTTTIAVTVDTSFCNPDISPGRKSSSARRGGGNQNTQSGLAPWTYKIFPLPADDNLTFQFNNLATEGDITIELLDLSGRMLIQESIPVNAVNKALKNLDISDLADGEYIVKIRYQQELKTSKVVVN